MFKNQKLGTKIAAGFSIVLLLTVLVGFIGYHSLNGVSTIVDKADDGNRLIKHAKDARQQEKNFMLRKDKRYQEENDKTMQAIYDQIETTMAKLRDPADRDLLDRVETAARVYKENFDAWVTLSGRQEHQAQAMVENARAFTTQCEALRSNQKNEHALARDERARKVDDKLWKADAANRLVKLILDAKADRLSLMSEYDSEVFGEWERKNQEILSLTEELKERFQDPENRSECDAIVESYSDYIAAFKMYLQNPADYLRGQAAEASEKAVKAIETLRADQKAELAGVRKASVETEARKLEQADAANRLIKFAKGRPAAGKKFHAAWG